MNWLFRFFVLVGSLVVVALFSALLAPYFVNWERFTADFERQASRIVGQPVTVGGKSNLRLLPLPFVSFEELKVGQNEDGTPLMTVERFSLNMELFPFLSGEVRIVEMAMLRPKVNLKVADNGTIAWTSPQEVVVNPEQINIEKLSVENGSIIVDGLAGDRQLTFENIQGDLSARSVLGPWRIDASAEIDGNASDLKISTGTFQANERSVRLKIEATRRDQPYKLLMDGPVKLEKDVLNWGGQFHFAPYSQSRLAGFGSAAKPLPVHSDGVFSVTPKLVDIPEYRMEIGDREHPYTLTGHGRVFIQDNVFFRFFADGRQIDLDRFDQSVTPTDVPSFERRIAVVRSILERIPVPTGTGEINAVLPAIVAGDTFIRDVKTIVRPLGKGWDLRSFSAIFPGNTLVEANGRLGLNENFGFAGKMLIASRQPSGLAAWMSGDVDAQIRRLKVLGLDSDVTLTQRQALLENLELRMDDAVLRGKLQRLAPVDERAALIAELRGNRVNIQDLRALYSLIRSSGESELASHDLDIRIKADVLEAQMGDNPVVAGDVDAHVRVKAGNVSIERLNAGNFYQSKVNSTGRLENVLNNPDGNLKLDIKTDDARELLKFTAGFTGDHFLLNDLISDRLLTENTELSVELDTRSADDQTKGQLLINGETGGTTVEARLAFDGSFTEPENATITANASFSNSSSSRLFRQMSVETLPDVLIDAEAIPAKFNIDMKGNVSDGFETNFGASGPKTNVSAGGTVKFITSQEIDAALDVTIGAGNLTPYLLMTGFPVPGLSPDIELPVSLKFKLSKKNPSAIFDDIAGQVGGNTVEGNLEYQFEGVQRPKLSGHLNLSDFSVPLVADSVFGRSDLLGAGAFGLEQDREFNVSIYSGFDAKIKIEAENIATGLGTTGSSAATELVMLDGAVDLNDVSFLAMGGEFSGSASVKNVEGTVLGTVQFSLKNAEIDRLRSLMDLPDFASGRLSLNGSLETSGRSRTAMISNLAGNGIVSFGGLSIEGIDPNSFPDILLQTDVEGFEIYAEGINALIDETVLVSGFDIDSIDSPFSVTRGRLKIRNLVHETEQTDFNSSMEVDLSGGMLQAATLLTFKPGKRDRISGTDPVVTISWDGQLSNPGREIDSSQLEGYLSLRAFENSQRRIETLEAQVIEKQRIQREIAFNFAREQHEIRVAEEALRALEVYERKRIEEAIRKLQDDRARLEEEARIREEEARRLEEQRKAEELARIEAEKARKAEEARRLAEEQRRLEELRKAEEQARLEAERQAAAKRAAEQAFELEALRQAEERRRAAEAAAAEERRLAAEAAAVEREIGNTGSGIEGEPLPPAKPADNEGIAPSLRENIIQNIENFLNTN